MYASATGLIRPVTPAGDTINYANFVGPFVMTVYEEEKEPYIQLPVNMQCRQSLNTECTSHKSEFPANLIILNFLLKTICYINVY